MPDFKFKLNAVLEYRKKIEDIKKKELAELKELLRREEVLLRELDKKRNDILEQLKTRQKGVINLEDIINYSNYLNDCREKILQQIVLIKQLIDNVEAKREDLVSASKDKKIIEKLKENQYKEFKETMDKIETKLLDELGTNGYNYKNNAYVRT
jgi:flagellar protein FliJ